VILCFRFLSQLSQIIPTLPVPESAINIKIDPIPTPTPVVVINNDPVPLSPQSAILQNNGPVSAFIAVPSSSNPISTPVVNNGIQGGVSSINFIDQALANLTQENDKSSLFNLIQIQQQIIENI
jgi:hypothetical protein